MSEVVEHAIMLAGGGMHVRNGHPEIDRIYPLAEWIRNERRVGARVYQRTIIVVQDWAEVTIAEDLPGRTPAAGGPGLGSR